MSTSELSLFSYEILGLVGRQGAGAHDLRRWARQGRFLDWAGESQYYTEPKRLARLGYLDASREAGRTREKTVYRLTERGREALRAYASTPIRFQAIKSDLLLRLLICDLVGDEPTREAARGFRAELADLRAALETAEERAAALPHRARNLLLVTGFIRRLLDLHADLVDEIERELGP